MEIIGIMMMPIIAFFAASLILFCYNALSVCINFSYWVFRAIIRWSREQKEMMKDKL